VALGGGFTFEDQIFKGLALGAPYAKAVAMARAPLAAAMVGKTIGRRIQEGMLPIYIERFGTRLEEIFVTAPELHQKYGDRFKKIPPGALGLYTYFERLVQGLRQFMCGARKFSLEHIARTDIAALTRQAAEVSGISYITEVDREEAEKILDS